MSGWLSLLSVIVKNVDVLTLFNVEMLMHFKIVYVAGAIKIILIKWIISENRQLFSVDRLCICKSKNVSDYKQKAGQLKRSYKKKQLWKYNFSSEKFRARVMCHVNSLAAMVLNNSVFREYY